MAARLRHDLMMDTYDDDPTSQLRVRYAPDADGTGKLLVRAAFNGFSGEASAWFNTNSLIEFATALQAYPLPRDSPVTISGGFGSLDQPGVTQEQIGLDVRPEGIKGQVVVLVHLATHDWTKTHPESINDVHLELPTTYERLRRFSDHMTRVLRGGMEEAELGGERLA